MKSIIPQAMSGDGAAMSEVSQAVMDSWPVRSNNPMNEVLNIIELVALVGEQGKLTTPKGEYSFKTGWTRDGNLSLNVTLEDRPSEVSPCGQQSSAPEPGEKVALLPAFPEQSPPPLTQSGASHAAQAESTCPERE